MFKGILFLNLAWLISKMEEKNSLLVFTANFDFFFFMVKHRGKADDVWGKCRGNGGD